MDVNVPFYQEIPTSEAKMFTVQVEALNVVAQGTARSKKEAKHLAASKLLQTLGVERESAEKVDRDERDHVSALLDICLQKNFPLAQFVETDACGPSNAPSFTCKCYVSQIKRTGVHSTKKGAKQLAAKAMLDVFREMYPDDRKILMPLSETMQAAEPTDVLFKKYRDWRKSDSKIFPGVKLADRHNFFLKSENYDKAVAVLQMEKPAKEKVNLLAEALGFELMVTKEEGMNEGLLTVELDCDFETIHIGREEQVYRDFLDYMEKMLNYV